MNRPSFFIAGNSKSGTTALYAFLNAHPELFLCDPKEPDYFARAFCRNPDPDGAFHPRTEAEYLALFADARPDQVCGEASAVYLYAPDAAEALHAFDPDARLIFMLREPVDFLHSYHLQLLKNPITEGEAVASFEEALALEPARKRGEAVPEGCLIPELLYYRERIRYAEHLRRYYDRFPADQILVILYDDFKRDNEGVYARVLEFLGVDAAFRPVFEQHNQGARLRSKRLQRLMRQVTFGDGWAAAVKGPLKALLPQALRRGMVDAIYRHVVFRPKDQLDPALVRALRREFRPEVEKAGALLDRDLVALWGYDVDEPVEV